MENRNFQSAKFFLLPNVGVEARMNKRKSTCYCIIALCLLIGLLSTFFFCQTIFSLYSSGNNSNSSGNIYAGEFHNSLDLFKKKIWIPIDNDMSRYSSKLRCTKSQGFSFANHPLDIFTKEGSEFYLLSIYDHINVDLLMHFERIISQYNPHRLRLFFSEFSKKLSLAKTPKGFILFLKSVKSEKFNLYTAYLEKQNVRIEMARFEYFFNLTDELNKWYLFLDDLSNFLSRYEQQKQRQKYRLALTKSNFKNILTKIQEKLYVHPLVFNCTDQKLLEINKIIKEWTESPIVETFHSYIVIQNKVLLASEVNNYLKDLKLTPSKTLYIFGRNTVYLDGDFVFPGNNVALMAPRWVFSRKIKIILDGRPGKEHEIKTASEGNPGKPGNPGENAGDFLGFGDINEKFLFTSNNGGKGGDGQNGAKGRDGANDTYPGPRINKPTCFSKIGVFKNPFGQIITHYQAFSEKGCGGPGTDGGIGGFGGKAGKSILFINNSLQYILRQGSDGMTGSPGKGGQGGHGGKNGCFYEVVDIDDEILHSVTRIKCGLNILPSGSSGKANANSQGQSRPLKKMNISLVDSIQTFLQYTGKQMVDYGDDTEMEFIKQLFSNPSLYIKTNFCESFEEFDIINKLNRCELFELLKIKINECLKTSKIMERVKLKYLNAITLGKLLTLKGNKNFLFVDIDGYLLDLETSIRSIKHGNFKIDSISQLSQNGNHKLIKIKERLNFIKSKIETEYSEISKDMEMLTLTEKENYENLAALMNRERIIYYLKEIIDKIIKFSTIHENQTFNSQNKVEIHNFPANYSLHSNEIRSNQFLSNLTSSQKKILSQKLNFTEHNELALSFPKSTAFVASYPVCKGKQLYDVWKKFPLDIKTGKEFLTTSLIIAECLSESEMLFGESKVMLEDLTDELNHFIEIYHIIEWSVLEKSFVESLHNLTEEGLEVSSDKKELQDMLVTLLYNLAVDAVHLKVYPLKVVNRDLVSSPDIADEALEQIQNLRVISNQEPLCENYHEAVFSKNTALGNFYFWPYSEIKHKLAHLFKGEEITLKASLNNRHILDKNFIKFKTLKLIFENGNSSLSDALRNFQAKITHSGYSYYNWRGETRVVVSDEVTLDYWLRTTENGVPEVYNSLFKKFHNGDAILSPYTTWSVRLLPIHDAADFNELRHFENIDIRLTGTGTFIS